MSILHETAERTLIETVDLVADQHLEIERRPGSNLLNIMSAGGVVTLSILVTSEGPVLRIDGAAIEIRAEGRLSIDAQEVAIRGRESVALTTGGDVEIQAEGDLHSTARIQHITADLGNVNIKANDDVKLNGERIRANC